MLKHIISRDILIIVNSVENNLKPEPVIETISVHMQLINLNKYRLLFSVLYKWQTTAIK